MMSKEKNKFGVPRPFKNTTLASPNQIVKVAINPFKMYHLSSLLLILMIVSYIATNTVYEIQNTIRLLLIYTSITLLSAVVGLYGQTSARKRRVRSIRRVSRIDEYMKSASRLFVLSICLVLFGTSFSSVLHIFSSVSVSDLTRFLVFVSLSVGLCLTYIIIKTIYTYTPYFKSGISVLPVKSSSIPEIMSFISFVFPPLIVSVAAFLYDGDSYIFLPFSFSVYDMFMMTLSVLVLYIAVVSRIKITS